RRTIVFSAIPQGSLAMFPKPLSDAIDGGVMCTRTQNILDFAGTTSVPQIEHDQIAYAHRSVPAFPKPLAHPLLDEPGNFGENTRHGNSSLGPCWFRVLMRE